MIAIVITPWCIPALIAVKAELSVVKDVGPIIPAVAVTDTCAKADWEEIPINNTTAVAIELAHHLSIVGGLNWE
jgi:hypothetical protein